MRLFHGSNITVEAIDLSKSKRYKDFGQAFYLSAEKEQALKMAEAKVVQFGGQEIISEFEFDELVLSNKDLNVKIFVEYSEEWAEFVFKNRNEDIRFVHDYDIVIGPIADDKVGLQLWRYEIRSIDLPTLVRNLQYMKGVTIQYFFGTERAINILRRV